MVDDNAIMKPAEVAEYLRIPLRTLYKLCNDGYVPATRVGKHWRFRKSEIDKWFDENNQVARGNLGLPRTAGVRKSQKV